MTTSVATNYQRGFQVPASPIAEGINIFHDDLRIFLTGILFFVMYRLYACLVQFGSQSKTQGKVHRLVHASVLEVV